MGMTSDEAVALMVDGAFQERPRRGEGRAGPAVVDPALDVLPGLVGMWAIEHEARRRAAVAGGRADATDRAAGRGGYPRDARVRAPRAPRGGDRPRRSPDPILRRILFD